MFSPERKHGIVISHEQREGTRDFPMLKCEGLVGALEYYDGDAPLCSFLLVS
jgi:hypothetical protein